MILIPVCNKGLNVVFLSMLLQSWLCSQVYLYNLPLILTAVQGNRRCYKETISDNYSEREPLFPLPNVPLCAQANCEVASGMGSSAVNVVPSSHSQPPKKSLATTIVESTKKGSVALVPREIANLAQRFFPLFNPALFPHKPPPAAVRNRVLFTDAEDE